MEDGLLNVEIPLTPAPTEAAALQELSKSGGTVSFTASSLLTGMEMNRFISLVICEFLFNMTLPYQIIYADNVKPFNGIKSCL